MTTSGSCCVDRLQQAAGAEQVAEVVEQPAGRRELGDQPVLDVEQPGHPAEGEARAVAHDRRRRSSPSPRGRSSISTSAPGISCFEVGLDDPRRQVVALADVGGEDEHPRRALLGARGAGEQRPGGVVVAVQRRLLARDRVRRAGRAARPTRRTCARPRGSSSPPSSRAPRARARWRSPCRGSRPGAAACGRSRSRRCFPAPARRSRGSSRPRRRRGCRCGWRPRAPARRRCPSARSST